MTRENKRAKLPSWAVLQRILPSRAVLVLTTLAANVLVYLVWISGVWIADHIGVWLCWALGLVFLFVVPFVCALFGYFLSGMKEEPAVLPGTVVSILLMLASPSIAPRLIAPNPICETSFAQAPEEALRCEFLCFPEVEVFPEVMSAYTTSSKSGTSNRRTYNSNRLYAMGAPGARGPYQVWVKEDRESDGRCIWQEREAKALASVRSSPSGTERAIVGEQVKDPAASLARYRGWLFIILGAVNVIALLAGLLVVGREAQGKRGA